jgi:hypothetical protein
MAYQIFTAVFTINRVVIVKIQIIESVMYTAPWKMIGRSEMVCKCDVHAMCKLDACIAKVMIIQTMSGTKFEEGRIEW